MSLLELENVTASYGHAQALHGVSLSLPENGAVGILGANGAGKTTTLRAISGTLRTTGRILFDGRDISGLGPDKTARLGIAHVPEGRGTLPQLSVRDNLLVGAYQRKDRKAVASDIDYCLDLFPNLQERIKSNAAALSGGEQQMLAVARALVLNPKLVLLDEPTEGLAPIIIEELLAALKRIMREEGLSAIVVEQHAQKILGVTDSAIILDRGTIVHAGSSRSLIEDPTPLEQHLGVTARAKPARAYSP